MADTVIAASTTGVATGITGTARMPAGTIAAIPTTATSTTATSTAGTTATITVGVGEQNRQFTTHEWRRGGTARFARETRSDPGPARPVRVARLHLAAIAGDAS